MISKFKIGERVKVIRCQCEHPVGRTCYCIGNEGNMTSLSADKKTAGVKLDNNGWCLFAPDCLISLGINYDALTEIEE